MFLIGAIYVALAVAPVTTVPVAEITMEFAACCEPANVPIAIAFVPWFVAPAETPIAIAFVPCNVFPALLPIAIAPLL